MKSQVPTPSIILYFTKINDPQELLDLAQAMALYESTVLAFLFALRGAHDHGGVAKVKELEDLIHEWVETQIRIMEVGEP